MSQLNPRDTLARYERRVRKSLPHRAVNGLFLVAMYMLVLVVPWFAIYHYEAAASGAVRGAKADFACKYSFPTRCQPSEHCAFHALKGCVRR